MALILSFGVRQAVAAFPGLNGKIAFVSERDGNREIYGMNPDGSGVARLTNDPADDVQPQWSPDGTKIVFVRSGEIYVMNADGANVTRLTNNSFDDQTPAWSPDGQRIVFASNRAGTPSPTYGLAYSLYVMNADGTGVMRLTSGSENDSEPDWSVTGKIVFSRWDGSTFHIAVVNPDGSSLAQLTTVPSSHASWSPNGQRIVFSTGSGILVMNADGSNVATVVGDGNTRWPEWSPDGAQIVFWGGRTGNDEINVANADGTNRHEITNSPSADIYPDWAAVAPPAPLVVTNTDDSGPGSLRAAIQEANGRPGPDTITFAVTGTITLSGGLNVMGDVSLEGPGARSLTINGGGSSRIFIVNSGINVTINDVTVAHASITGDYGAAIKNAGTLTINDSTFDGNAAVGGWVGGALYNTGTLTISGSTFSNNSAFHGGAVYNDGGTVAVLNSTFSGNTSNPGDGAAFFAGSGALTLTNTTVSGNTATRSGGGIYAASGSVALKNTIVFGNNAGDLGPDCAGGGVVDGGANIVGPNYYCGAFSGADPRLDPAGLRNNGGPTDTIALQGGSPALDTAVAANCPTTDQRGIPRPQGPGCDIGAYEADDTTPPTVSCDAAEASIWYAHDVTVACTASDSGSGLARPADSSFSLTTSVADGSETANAETNSRDVADNAGNHAAAGPYTFKVDRKGPSVTCNGTPSFLLNASGASVSATVGDGGSGVTATSVSAPADTSSAGEKTVDLTGQDNAGNSTTVSCQYQVTYSFSGFTGAVNNPPVVNTGKSGKTYALKWQLRDANGDLVTSLGAVTGLTVKPTSCTAFTSDATDALEATATGGTSLRYDSTANQFVYNWATPGPGCYTLFVKLASGQALPAYFKLT